MVWSSSDYPFAQEYSVYGWFKSESSCDGDATVFRLVIDTDSEESNGQNPNFSGEEWNPDFN